MGQRPTDSSAIKRPLRASVRSFVLWFAGLLVVGTAVDRVIAGGGVGGVVEALFSFVWVGWIAVVGAIPIWLGFRWLLARFGPAVPGPIPARGAAIGLVWWLALAFMLLVYELIAWPFTSGSEPTVGPVVAALLAFGAIGSGFGFLEGRAIERAHVTFRR